MQIVWALIDSCMLCACMCQMSIITCHTSVSMVGTKFAVFSLAGYRYLSNGGTDHHEILHDMDPVYVFSGGGGCGAVPLGYLANPKSLA